MQPRYRENDAFMKRATFFISKTKKLLESIEHSK